LFSIRCHSLQQENGENLTETDSILAPACDETASR